MPNKEFYFYIYLLLIIILGRLKKIKLVNELHTDSTSITTSSKENGDFVVIFFSDAPVFSMECMGLKGYSLVGLSGNLGTLKLNFICQIVLVVFQVDQFLYLTLKQTAKNILPTFC